MKQVNTLNFRIENELRSFLSKKRTPGASIEV